MVRFNYFVVNKRTGKGLFGNYKGQFAMPVLRKDTIMVSAKDFYPIKIVVRDSCRSKNCMMRIIMRRKEIELRAVDILPIRPHSEIAKDLKDLVEPNKIERVTADAVMSPITALYQMFSKLEREKHEVRVLEAQDRKRDVLKELLAKYVQAEIIDLDEDQFDDFINTSEFNTDYLQTLNEYELIKYMEYRYFSYLKFNEFYNVFRRLDHNDYELSLLEATGEKQTVVYNLFRQFIDKDAWIVKSRDPEFIFSFVNYAQFDANELINLNDYGLIVKVKMKYEKFTGMYGSGKH
jgi:hypothetical protein